ncbi:MAG TPA: LamG-like jellyroll fold domain-containing protein, partial [Clostridia bacterium]|nr:LamG-like jellyroll fold domain-containing protein [Clostridia bacterium]
ITFSADVPPSKTGKSAMFNKTSGLMINNSSVLDSGYAPTFDNMIRRQFSVSFWAKGIPDTWNGFISKRGEEAIGWQVRRSGGITEAFTIRGTGSSNADGIGSVAINDGQWHHFAAVWDGYTGTRKCYVDGVLDPSVNLVNDFGPMTMAPNHHLVLGAREAAAVSLTPGYEGYYQGSLYDVSLYNYPLSETQVKELAFVPALRVIPAQRSLQAPLMMTADVILPAGANATQPVTVQVTDNTPAVASLVGALNNVVTLTFPVGGSLTQQVTVVGIKDGTGKLTATGGGFVAASATFNVWADPGSRLIGRWISGAGDLVETSGFRPAGTHDGVAVGPNAQYLMFSADVPPAFVGTAQSLDLTAGDVAVIITNTSNVELGYVETFDNQIAKKFSLAFWAKGTPAGTWNPWITKHGEGDYGFQMRRYSEDNPFRPTFTIRGSAGVDDPWQGTTVNDGEWHHYTGTWDGTTGIRKLYIDGKAVLTMTGDFGSMGLATLEHVMLGGRDTRGSFGNFFSGLLFDVRIYSYALDPLEVGVIVNPPTALSLTLSPLVAPKDETLRLVVNVPPGATANAPLTVYLTNNSPTVVKFVGYTENVIPVVFPVGTAAQSVQLLTIGVGQINITAGAAGQASTSLATVNTVVERKLIGHWFTGTAELADKSGYTPAGTHNAVAVGDYPELLAFSSDVPPSFQGQSLDLTANATGTVGVMVDNTALNDLNYQPTFDEGISGTFTVALWAKGVPGGWNGFISKRGEDGIGWQVRRGGGDTEAFTIRGTASGNVDGVGSVVITDGQWHHFAGVWNGVTGTRKCYVDGVLDPSVDLIEDFAPMNLAPNHHLAIGAREAASQGMFEGWFNGKVYDVRVYNYPITSEDVALLAGLEPAGPPMTIQPWTGNQVRISWPTSFTGYTIEQSSSIPNGWAASGLAVTVEGNENVAYAPTMGSAQFYRLKK